MKSRLYGSKRSCRLRTFRTEAARAALVAALLGTGLAAFWPAIGQDRPESILPPGFEQPVTTPTPSAPATRAPSTTAPPATAPNGSGATDGAPAGSSTETAGVLPDALPSPSPSATPPSLAGGLLTGAYVRYEMPDYARRSLGIVGAAGGTDGGFGPRALGSTDGVYAEVLMRQLDAPVASRWLAIGLRRLLLSPLNTPARVNGADFAAERAWLLLRMGESIAARGIARP